ncbi:MAG: helix-turn-helix transcriptional regulator, partial [Candidatus Hydrothermarchaeales archaeon]
AWLLEGLCIDGAVADVERTLIDLISGSEGVTQDSIRFKTGFSKSKVSALLSDLEKKDIISRERLGRTYKVFISDWLKK